MNNELLKNINILKNKPIPSHYQNKRAGLFNIFAALNIIKSVSFLSKHALNKH